MSRALRDHADGLSVNVRHRTWSWSVHGDPPRLCEPSQGEDREAAASSGWPGRGVDQWCPLDVVDAGAREGADVQPEKGKVNCGK
jgi:hypothetical protein